MGPRVGNRTDSLEAAGRTRSRPSARVVGCPDGSAGEREG